MLPVQHHEVKRRGACLHLLSLDPFCRFCTNCWKVQSHHLEKLITTTRKRLGSNSNIETWSIFIKDKNPIRFYHKHETLTSILPSETNITVWTTVMLVECAFQLEEPTPYQSWGRCLEPLQNESVHHCKHNKALCKHSRNTPSAHYLLLVNASQSITGLNYR